MAAKRKRDHGKYMIFCSDCSHRSDEFDNDDDFFMTEISCRACNRPINTAGSHAEYVRLLNASFNSFIRKMKAESRALLKR